MFMLLTLRLAFHLPTVRPAYWTNLLEQLIRTICQMNLLDKFIKPTYWITF